MELDRWTTFSLNIFPHFMTCYHNGAEKRSWLRVRVYDSHHFHTLWWALTACGWELCVPRSGYSNQDRNIYHPGNRRSLGFVLTCCEHSLEVELNCPHSRTEPSTMKVTFRPCPLFCCRHTQKHIHPTHLTICALPSRFSLPIFSCKKDKELEKPSLSSQTWRAAEKNRPRVIRQSTEYSCTYMFECHMLVTLSVLCVCTQDCRAAVKAERRQIWFTPKLNERIIFCSMALLNGISVAAVGGRLVTAKLVYWIKLFFSFFF